MTGVLTEIMSWINDDRFPWHTEFNGTCSLVECSRQDVLHHVRVLHSVWACTWSGATGVRAHEANLELGCHLGKFRVIATPGVIHEVGTLSAYDSAHLGPPGVNANHDVVAGSNLGHQ